MAKSADAFRTISEVAEWLETPAHVLRFWESKFSQVKPVKRAGGRRYYRPADMKLLGGIKKLLHEDGMTIKGVQKMLREEGIKPVAALSQPLDEVTDIVAGELAADVPQEQQGSTVLSFQRGVAPPSEPDAEPENIFAGEDTAEGGAATAPPDDDAPPAPEMQGSADADAAPPAPPAPERDTVEAGPSDPPEDGPATAPQATDAATARDAAPTDKPQEIATEAGGQTRAETDGAPPHPAPGEDRSAIDPPEDASLTTDAPQTTDAAATDTDAETPPDTGTDTAGPAAPGAAQVPDDPPDDIAAPPGVLTAMLARQRVPPGIARQLADLAARLTPPPGR